MKKYFFASLMLFFFAINCSSAQFRGGGGMGRRFGGQKNRRSQTIQSFKPTLDLSVGYAFPNLDKQLLPDFDSYYKGSFSQTGPVTLALDYRFMQRMSLGLMITSGKVSVPYYDFNNNPAFTGTLQNTAVMLDIIKYVPVTGKISPYVRTAIGINIWKQNYIDNSGNHIDPGVVLPDLAYQASFGAKFQLSKQTGMFIEAGYGKYILHAGLSLKL